MELSHKKLNMDEIKSQPNFPAKNSPLIRAKIEIAPSPINRYGVFARENIAAGTIIEECPIIFTRNDAYSIDYAFNWDNSMSALALGYGALYNHSENPNATYSTDKKTGIITFKAIKPIKKDEEIFVNYGKNWFPYRNKKPRELRPPSQTQKILKFLFVAATLTVMLMIASTINNRFNSIALKFPFRFAPTPTTSHQTPSSMHSETPSTAPHK